MLPAHVIYKTVAAVVLFAASLTVPLYTTGVALWHPSSRVFASATTRGLAALDELILIAYRTRYPLPRRRKSPRPIYANTCKFLSYRAFRILIVSASVVSTYARNDIQSRLESDDVQAAPHRSQHTAAPIHSAPPATSPSTGAKRLPVDSSTQNFLFGFGFGIVTSLVCGTVWFIVLRPRGVKKEVQPAAQPAVGAGGDLEGLVAELGVVLDLEATFPANATKSLNDLEGDAVRLPLDSPLAVVDVEALILHLAIDQAVVLPLDEVAVTSALDTAANDRQHAPAGADPEGVAAMVAAIVDTLPILKDTLPAPGADALLAPAVALGVPAADDAIAPESDRVPTTPVAAFAPTTSKVDQIVAKFGGSATFTRPGPSARKETPAEAARRMGLERRLVAEQMERTSPLASSTCRPDRPAAHALGFVRAPLVEMTNGRDGGGPEVGGSGVKMGMGTGKGKERAREDDRSKP
ncbi:hypothetical protein C8F04DRAFT_1234932 [Mycena alexandri]|uniref:Uncharacterized protein n=1 Tax=Mycena alexandri TaxID=1745969 RepID=A0AAD6X5P6_9AGAR|nr:hypothetical protein C8F04DRAFT_1234932 [Mycena alexandri]